jgi:thermostable 8-oxoguanine DNA glycosylase
MNDKTIIKRIRDWEPDHNDFAFGRTLIIIEDYSKTVQRYGAEDFHYGALLYSILSLREKFDQHKKQFNEFLCNDYWTAQSILENRVGVEKILKRYGFQDRKIQSVFSSAEEWPKMNITKRMREDKNKGLGEIIRKEIDDRMYGVGYKFASLFIRMSGYEDIAPIDNWATMYLESRGVTGRHARSGLKPKQYVVYENKLREYAERFNVSVALFQATIYATWSTWKKDSGILPNYR